MKKTLFIILTLSSLKMVGQNNFIGISGGVNYSNVFINNVATTDTKFVNNFVGGLSFEHFFAKQYSISADILFNRFGFKEDWYFTNNFGQVYVYQEPVNTAYDYLSLPIKTGITFGKKLFGTIKIGVCPSYLIDAKFIIPAYGENAYHRDATSINIASTMQRFDIGGLIEVGGGYKFKDKYFVFSNVSYRQSFTTFTSPYNNSGGQLQHYGVTVSVGLKYALTKQ